MYSNLIQSKPNNRFKNLWAVARGFAHELLSLQKCLAKISWRFFIMKECHKKIGKNNINTKFSPAQGKKRVLIFANISKEKILKRQDFPPPKRKNILHTYTASHNNLPVIVHKVCRQRVKIAQESRQRRNCCRMPPFPFITLHSEGYNSCKTTFR